jgi:hypothetical protein
MSGITNPPNAAASPNYSIDQILQATQPPKQPGAFRKVLGAVVGGVGNMFAPGIGGLIGGAIGGGILGGGIGGSLTLGSGGNDPMQFLQLQQQMSMQQEAFESVSAVMKSRHDASMAAIRNVN